MFVLCDRAQTATGLQSRASIQAAYTLSEPELRTDSAPHQAAFRQVLCQSGSPASPIRSRIDIGMVDTNPIALRILQIGAPVLKAVAIATPARSHQALRQSWNRSTGPAGD